MITTYEIQTAFRMCKLMNGMSISNNTLLEKHPALLEQLSDDAVNQVRDETSDDVTVISFQA